MWYHLSDLTRLLNCGQEVAELDCVASRMNVVDEVVGEGGVAELVIVVREGVIEGATAGDAEVSLFYDRVATTAPPIAALTIASNKIAPIRHANFTLIPHTRCLPLRGSLFQCVILRGCDPSKPDITVGYSSL